MSSRRPETLSEILSIHQNGERWFNRQLASSGSIITADMGQGICDIYTRHFAPFKASRILIDAALGYLPSSDNTETLKKLDNVIAQGLPIRVAPIIKGTLFNFNFVWALGNPETKNISEIDSGEIEAEGLSAFHDEPTDKIYFPLDENLENCLLLPVNDIRIAAV